MPPHRPPPLLREEEVRLPGVPAAQLPPGTHPHTLRHTAATAMLCAGTPLPEVARILGHASPQVTATAYAHVLPAGGEPAAKRLEAFYAGPTSSP